MVHKMFNPNVTTTFGKRSSCSRKDWSNIPPNAYILDDGIGKIESIWKSPGN